MIDQFRSDEHRAVDDVKSASYAAIVKPNESTDSGIGLDWASPRNRNLLNGHTAKVRECGWLLWVAN